FWRHLEKLRGEPSRLLDHLTACPPDRRPAELERPGPERPVAARNQGRIRVDHTHALERDTEQPRGDLGERGLVSLAVRGRTHPHGHVSTWIHLDGAELLSRAGRTLDVRADADAELPRVPPFSSFALLVSQPWEVRHAKRLVQG